MRHPKNLTFPFYIGLSGAKCYTQGVRSFSALLFIGLMPLNSKPLPVWSDDNLVGSLNEATKAFRKIAKSFAGLETDNGHCEEGFAIQMEFEIWKKHLEDCPAGNPGKVASRPSRRTSNVVVAAFGNLSESFFRASLAWHEWQAALLNRQISELQPDLLWAAVVSISSEVGCSAENLLSKFVDEASGKTGTTSDGVVQKILARANEIGPNDSTKHQLAEMFLRIAELHARLLEFDSAHSDVLKSLRLQPGWHKSKAMAHQYAKAVAACSHDFLRVNLVKDSSGVFESPWSGCGNILLNLRTRLLACGYTHANILASTKTDCLLALFAEGDIEHFSTDADSILLDAVRIFLLHQHVETQLIVRILGEDNCIFLLEEGLITICRAETGEVVGSSESFDLIQTLSRGGTDEGHTIFANVTIWPVMDDLLVCTDCDEQAFEQGHFEPVMYLSVDSTALVSSAPRRNVAEVLDLCCGCGIQGLVALKTYADKATFVDVNRRAVAFSSFNVALNGFENRASFVLADLTKETLKLTQKFGAILANPPFVPNPDGIASVLGPLYSSGGQDGQDVLKAVIQQCINGLLLELGGCLTVVAQVPNAHELPSRITDWILDDEGRFHRKQSQLDRRLWKGQVFRSQATSVAEFQLEAFLGRPTIEREYYVSGLQSAGVKHMSEIILSMWSHGLPPTSDSGIPTFQMEPDHLDLWSDLAFLESTVRKTIADGLDRNFFFFDALD